MKQDKSAQTKESIEGSVDRITFHNEENGFCVLRVKSKTHRDLVTIIGNVASITAGEYIRCKGVWFNDTKHGLQFKAEQIQAVPPTTLDGIQKYLGSGIIKGIGPHFAKKLINAFGEKVFDVIEKQPERLMKLEGIGEKRKVQVITAWAEQKAIRDIMVFLQSHGIGTARAVRIYKTYGDLAIKKVQENPYNLAQDIHGIGFKTADALAIRLGVPQDSIMRAQAGIHHVLHQICQYGHCAVSHEELIQTSISLLEIGEPTIKEAIDKEIAAERIIADTIDTIPCIFPISLYKAELSVANNLRRIMQGKLPWDEIDVIKAIPWIEQSTGLQLSSSQKKAIDIVLKNKLTIITGGPGVGKTTIVNSILKILRAKNLMISLAAPTGRAAKRLTESTKLIAKTIHRLLVFDPGKFAFKHNQQSPLPVDVLVIDEASMIDTVLLHHLLKAIPDHAALILIGDIDQLPSVGSGAVLNDLISSKQIPTVRLTQIFRQAANSSIILNAHRINQGKMLLDNKPPPSDFYSIYLDNAEEIHHQLVNLVATRIPQYTGFHPIKDIQVLTPMNRGGLGTFSLNVALQKQLNGQAEPKITRYGITFAPGDKVIQTVNNYDKEVFNGDIGTIAHIDLENNQVKVTYDQKVVSYDFNDLDEMSLAYAISIHKSQGSEFPVVVIPVSIQHYMLLARNLLYTGVTRGKQLVVLIGEKKAVYMAIKNNKENKRLTKLATRIQENV